MKIYSRRLISVVLFSAVLAGKARAENNTTAASDHSDAHQAQDPPPPAFVFFEMGVNWSTVAILQNYMIDLVNKNTNDIHLVIDSGGGDVSPAIACYNFLSALDISLTTHNGGDVDSAALLLFLAGSKRYSSKNGRFLFHEVRTNVAPNSSWSTSDYDKNKKSLDDDSRRLEDIYVDKTKISQEHARALLSTENWIDAKTAVKLGVIDSIEPLHIPFSSPIYSVPVPIPK